MKNEIPAWLNCQCCDGLWCNIHGQHVAECGCPERADWKIDPCASGAESRTTIRKTGRAWEWRIVCGKNVLAGGYCRSKKSAQNDARIVAQGMGGKK